MGFGVLHGFQNLADSQVHLGEVIEGDKAVGRGLSGRLRAGNGCLSGLGIIPFRPSPCMYTCKSPYTGYSLSMRSRLSRSLLPRDDNHNNARLSRTETTGGSQITTARARMPDPAGQEIADERSLPIGV